MTLDSWLDSITNGGRCAGTLDVVVPLDDVVELQALNTTPKVATSDTPAIFLWFLLCDLCARIRFADCEILGFVMGFAAGSNILTSSMAFMRGV